MSLLTCTLFTSKVTNMSELVHPRIEYDIESEDSSELTIVNDLVAILKLRQHGMQYFVGDLEVNTAVTENVEMYSMMEDIGVAMKITRTPVLASPSALPDGELHPSSAYLVLTVEFGEVDVEEVEQVGQTADYEWHPYITAIVDRSDSDHPEIVRTASGKPLNELELMHAGSIIDQMKKEAVSTALSDELWYDEAEPYYRHLDSLSATPITAAELADRIHGGAACRYCREREIVCHHPQAN